MTGYRRHDLPADITVHVGRLDNQPATFAALLAACPALDLTHVEVIQGDPRRRLRARFAPQAADEIAAQAAGWSTIVLILPAAYPGLVCPLPATRELPHLGLWRGTVPHLVVEPRDATP
jgi:hypothetical protein